MMISVVIPVFNSENSLEELYCRLKKILPELCDNFEIIMVDDCSKDKSFQMMRKLRNHDKRVKIIRLAVNSGQHNATFCGLVNCHGDYVITIDDDLQHPPEAIPVLIKEIQEGHDVVFGIPRQKQHKTYRNWGSILIDKCIGMIFPFASDIKRSSFRALSKVVVKKMISNPKFPIYMAALILLNSSNPGNVNVRHENRKYGKSNYSIKKSVTMTMTLLIHYSSLPLKALSILWKCSLFITIILIIIFVLNTKSSDSVSGVTSTYPVIIAILSTVVFSILGGYFNRRHNGTEKPVLPFTIDEIDI